MNILSQNQKTRQNEIIIETDFYSEINRILSIVYQKPGVTNYVDLIRGTDKE